MKFLRLSPIRVMGLGVISGLLIVAVLLFLHTSGCVQHCGACLGPKFCAGELADAATCPSHDGACALQNTCMCFGVDCGNKCGGSADEATCNSKPGCSWVSVCNFVYPCGQFDSTD